jgi:hypothetical protein
LVFVVGVFVFGQEGGKRALQFDAQSCGGANGFGQKVGIEMAFGFAAKAGRFGQGIKVVSAVIRWMQTRVNCQMGIDQRLSPILLKLAVHAAMIKAISAFSTILCHRNAILHACYQRPFDAQRG